jgi:mannose-6-phosphate isomerase-like protein (cupin superfamily)
MTETASPARKPGDHPFEAVHADERDWETQRFGGYQSKMLFHPRPERPTEPNAGLIRFAPGSSHPVHRHDFAQIWYILEGEFVIDGRNYGPGTMVFHPDPLPQAGEEGRTSLPTPPPPCGSRASSH